VTGEKVSSSLLGQLVKNVVYVSKATTIVKSETEGQSVKTTGWFVQAKPIANEPESWGVEAHAVCAEL
jgi:hypothetical protein